VGVPLLTCFSLSCVVNKRDFVIEMDEQIEIISCIVILVFILLAEREIYTKYSASFSE